MGSEQRHLNELDSVLTRPNVYTSKNVQKFVYDSWVWKLFLQVWFERDYNDKIRRIHALCKSFHSNCPLLELWIFISVEIVH